VHGEDTPLTREKDPEKGKEHTRLRLIPGGQTLNWRENRAIKVAGEAIGTWKEEERDLKDIFAKLRGLWGNESGPGRTREVGWAKSNFL